ncbi:hypothetical protein BB561_005896 [Smittium simulii]|uniref:Uncharacterized protein n=1 Tax=Smittium simulii TaxID=133385 RepID=A0A2T9Y7N9_9FUNG|nr:hypothetical protein BB561_005896 [Smittium simulii]
MSDSFGPTDIPTKKFTTLLQFNAGRCFRDQSTNWVRPDNQRGICSILQDDEGIITFNWKKKGSVVPEESWITFPGDIDFVKANESNDREKDSKFDTKIAKAVVSIINNQDGDSDDSIEVELNSDTINLSTCDKNNNRSGQKIAVVIDSNSNQNTSVDNDTSKRHAKKSKQDVDFQISDTKSADMDSIMFNSNEALELTGENSDILSRFLPSTQVGGVPSAMGINSIVSANHDDIVSRPENPETSVQSTSAINQPLSSSIHSVNSNNRVLLSDIMCPETLLPLLEDSQVCQDLFSTLPDQADKTKNELIQTIRSAQFGQTLKSLDYAIMTGQMLPLAQSFGLPENAMTSVNNFLTAIKDKVSSQNNNVNRQDPENGKDK